MSTSLQAPSAMRVSPVGPLLLWAAYLALDTGSQLAFKWASNIVGAGALDLRWLLRALTAPSLWVGVACYLGTLIIWMRVLARMDLSRAFPISGLSYVTVPALAIPMFGESLAPLQVVGIAAICVGVALLALERAEVPHEPLPEQQED